MATLPKQLEHRTIAEDGSKVESVVVQEPVTSTNRRDVVTKLQDALASVATDIQDTQAFLDVWGTRTDNQKIAEIRQILQRQNRTLKTMRALIRVALGKFDAQDA